MCPWLEVFVESLESTLKLQLLIPRLSSCSLFLLRRSIIASASFWIVHLEVRIIVACVPGSSDSSILCVFFLICCVVKFNESLSQHVHAVCNLLVFCWCWCHLFDHACHEDVSEKLINFLLC
jgi:hypothetical protein